MILFYEILLLKNVYALTTLNFSNGIILCSRINRSTKTFKPKKSLPDESYQCDLMKYASDTLGSGDLRLAVQLPEGGDLNEWVASNSK